MNFDNYSQYHIYDDYHDDEYDLEHELDLWDLEKFQESEEV